MRHRSPIATRPYGPEDHGDTKRMGDQLYDECVGGREPEATVPWAHIHKTIICLTESDAHGGGAGEGVAVPR